MTCSTPRNRSKLESLELVQRLGWEHLSSDHLQSLPQPWFSTVKPRALPNAGKGNEFAYLQTVLRPDMAILDGIGC